MSSGPSSVKTTAVTKHPKKSTPSTGVPPIPGAVVKGSLPVGTSVRRLPKSGPNVTTVSSDMSIEKLRALRQYGSASLVDAARDSEVDRAPQQADEEETRDLISSMLLRYCRAADTPKWKGKSKSGGGSHTDPSAEQMAREKMMVTDEELRRRGFTLDTLEMEPANHRHTPPEIILFNELVHLCTTRDVSPHSLELIRELLSRTRVIPYRGSGGTGGQQLSDDVKRREFAQQLIIILLTQLKEKKLQERMGVATNVSVASMMARVKFSLESAMSEPVPSISGAPSKGGLFAQPSLAGSHPQSVAVPVHTTPACTRTTRFGVQQFSPSAQPFQPSPSPAFSSYPVPQWAGFESAGEGSVPYNPFTTQPTDPSSSSSFGVSSLFAAPRLADTFSTESSYTVRSLHGELPQHSATVSFISTSAGVEHSQCDRPEEMQESCCTAFDVPAPPRSPRTPLAGPAMTSGPTEGLSFIGSPPDSSASSPNEKLTDALLFDFTAEEDAREEYCPQDSNCHALLQDEPYQEPDVAQWNPAAIAFQPPVTTQPPLGMVERPLLATIPTNQLNTLPVKQRHIPSPAAQSPVSTL